MAQQFVLRLIFLEKQLSPNLFSQWTATNSKEASDAHIHSFSILKRMKILIKEGQSNAEEVILNSEFRKSLKAAISSGLELSVLRERKSVDEKKPSDFAITAVCKRKWENILYFMLGLEKESVVAPSAIKLLRDSRFIEMSEGKYGLTVTGFQFILLDNKSQVHNLILKYIQNSSNSGRNIVEVLKFMFNLAYAISENGFDKSILTTTQTSILSDLIDLGLIYERKRNSKRFYITSIMKGFLNAADSSAQDHHKDDRFIVVETNFRVFAYTRSKLHIALLGLFLRMDYKFSNLIIGTITRKSIRQAFQKGIAATQIANFLENHAHQSMIDIAEKEQQEEKNLKANQEARKEEDKKPSIEIIKTRTMKIIPEGIYQQIVLWEEELNCLERIKGILVSNFESEDQYSTFLDRAKQKNIVLYNSNYSRTIILQPESEDLVDYYLRTL